MDLDFVRIECEIVAVIPAQLSTALHNTLRNFEALFKASCCLNLLSNCTSCCRLAGCPYRIVFDQTLSSDPEIVRLHQKPSLPFSLYINGIDGNASSCTVGLVIIGNAVNYIGPFHAALLSMVDTAVCAILPRSKYTLHSYSLDYQSIRHEITDAALLTERVILLSGQHILQNTVHCDSVKMVLKSPLRLSSNASIVHRFDFALFFRSQLRRCSSLYAYYGSGKLDMDFTRISESAQYIAVFDDKIHYTQPMWSKRLNRAGLTGSIECSGLVEPMLSLLLLGSYFNAGKGATFGAGFYQLEVL